MILLCILDGWGINNDTDGNAYKAAYTPSLDKIFAHYPHTQLSTSGPAAGLPEGQMGNSEVGHLNMGAGRIVNQSIQQINVAIADGSFFKNKALLKAIRNAKEKQTSLHLFGLLSDGGVHTTNKHLYALLQLAKQENLKKVFIHCFMDGRDTAPTSGITFMQELLDEIKRCDTGEIATVCGRYYAMDRDNRWDRVEKAYQALVNGVGEYAESPLLTLEQSYAKNLTDEFIMPTVITKNDTPIAKISDNDSVIFFNFRPDRAREITYSLINESFSGFVRQPLHNLTYICMTEYDKKIDAEVAFKPETLTNVLAEVLANHNKTQLHIAETEKYAHVTFFFNGGREAQYPGEERILIPSPQIPTYDSQPEMSAYEVTEKVIHNINEKKFDVIILNFANPDMVGHTGNMAAAVKAMEAVDSCVGKIVEAALAVNSKIILTSDHGNLEYMIDKTTGEAYTAHTTNDVPLVFISNDKGIKLADQAILADIAPTILQLMSIAPPEEMTGKSIIC